MIIRKKVIYTITSICSIFIIFVISYTIGFNKLKVNNISLKNDTSEKLAVNASPESVVSPNAKVTFKILYAKSGDIDTREGTISDFAGKSKAQLESQGYVVESITKEEVVLEKKVDTYAPNKFVLGVKGNCFAIYKTDANGNMFIENESTDVTDIKVPTQVDYNLLVKGTKSFQCDTREQVEEKLGEFSS